MLLFFRGVSGTFEGNRQQKPLQQLCSSSGFTFLIAVFALDNQNCFPLNFEKVSAKTVFVIYSTKIIF